MKKLADIIVEFRQEHDLSQRQFAQQSGLSNGYISMLEKGINPATQKPVTPTLPQLKKLAGAMGKTVAELMEEAEDMPIDLGLDPERLKSTSGLHPYRPSYNQVTLVARNGEIISRKLSDEQLNALTAIINQLPDASEDL